MHTMSFKSGLRIHYNGGYEGNAILTYSETDQSMKVPIPDLLDFIASIVQFHGIGLLENLSAEQLISLWSEMLTNKNEEKQ